MKRFIALVAAVCLFVGGIATPLDVNGQSATAEARQAASVAPSDLTNYYTSVYLSVNDDEDKVLAVGKTAKLALSRKVTAAKWSSSNKKVATVSAAGTVRAKKPGKTVITVKDPATRSTATCTVKVYEKRTQSQARKAILSLKKKYYEGRSWTNDNYYFWDAAQMGCYGCVAFAAIASDKAFGKYAPYKVHRSFGKVKVGDSIRIGDWHSVVVLYKRQNYVVVCEGNYNSSIHWGSRIKYSYLKRQGFEVWTRYR